MKITSAEFTISAVNEDQYPKDGLPQIVLIGRSNVGKSSLINNIINRKGLAKTSSVPGKTRTINFYKVNKSFYLVDLPGYGYAKVPLSEKKSWEKVIETYINSSGDIAAFFIILDARRDTTEKEKDIYSWLESFDSEVMTVITKSDKLSSNKVASQKSKIKKALGIKEEDITIFSAETGKGKDELKKKIFALTTDR